MRFSAFSPLLLAAGLLAAPATAQPATETANFDAFLSGIDHACHASKPFEAFWSSLVARFDETGETRARVVVPPALAAAIGAPRGVDKGSFHQVRLGLKGTFRGLAVSAIEFSIGKGNGISAYRVEFAEPAARVRAVLGSAVARGKKQMAAEDDGGIGMSTGLDFSRGVAAVFCDQST